MLERLNKILDLYDQKEINREQFVSKLLEIIK